MIIAHSHTFEVNADFLDTHSTFSGGSETGRENFFSKNKEDFEKMALILLNFKQLKIQIVYLHCWNSKSIDKECSGILSISVILSELVWFVNESLAKLEFVPSMRDLMQSCMPCCLLKIHSGPCSEMNTETKKWRANMNPKYKWRKVSSSFWFFIWPRFIYFTFIRYTTWENITTAKSASPFWRKIVYYYSFWTALWSTHIGIMYFDSFGLSL